MRARRGGEPAFLCDDSSDGDDGWSSGGDEESDGEREWTPSESPSVVDLCESSASESESVDPDLACVLCHRADNEATMLLCDGCGCGFHLACLRLPAMPPAEVWQCPSCTDMMDAIARSAAATAPPTRRRARAAAARAESPVDRHAVAAEAAAEAAAAGASRRRRCEPEPVASARQAKRSRAPAPRKRARADGPAAEADRDEAGGAKRPRGRPRVRPLGAPRVRKPDAILTVSITVAMQQGNLPTAVWDDMSAWFTSDDDNSPIVAGLFSLERGGVFGHEHIQGVAKVLATTPQQVNKMIKDAIGWAPPPKGGVVAVRKCTGRALHTYHGLIGYCLKDEGMPWFKLCSHNVSEEDMRLGRDEYLKWGAGDLKKRTPLTPTSIFAKAAVFYQLHSRADRNYVTFQQLLLEMLRTGKYFPAATWVIPFQGRGMSHARATALWRMYTNPVTVQPHDVHEVFFHNGETADGAPNRGLRYFSPSVVDELIEKYFGNDAPSGERAEAAGAADDAAGATDAGGDADGTSDDGHDAPAGASVAWREQRSPSPQGLRAAAQLLGSGEGEPATPSGQVFRSLLPPNAAKEAADMMRFFAGVRARLPNGSGVSPVVARIHSVLAPPDLRGAYSALARAEPGADEGGEGAPDGAAEGAAEDVAAGGEGAL